MISNNTFMFCNEDVSLIENYNEAMASEKVWDCHHRKETDENLTKAQLKEMGLYYNRPASELIFLTRSDHQKIHGTGK